MQTDLTFFTNEPGSALIDRFRATLKDAKYFDILVGYFRTSGFHRLYQSFESIEKIRILVGLNVDRKAFEIIEAHRRQSELDFESHKRTKELFAESLTAEMDHSEDSYETELGVRKFIEFLKSGKLEIRAYPSKDIHAKVYISRFAEGDRDFGRVITGSSNFSESGLVANREFNVELKNSADVKFALAQFEALWKDGVDISKDYAETVNEKTWLNDQITPYDIYLKFLYEYFNEDINIDEDFEAYLPEGFMELAYQKQAVVSAKKILDAYNGVFLADVVGLGKTYISALLAQQLTGKILIICPPVLKTYWHDTFFDFGIRSFNVESLGKLDDIIKKGAEKYDYIFIDEAHRFRNELTQGYENLHRICFGKKVILVSATPLNNTIADIYSQLKLFQTPRKSDIPGIPNLEQFFAGLKKKIGKYDKTDLEYINTVKEASREMREKVLKPVMVRRTRTEVSGYFRNDMDVQGLSFPEIDNPQRVVYEFDGPTDRIFNETIVLLKQITYSRYTPLLSLKTPLSEFEQQSQRNIGGFMKGILVKRLESSFYAFRNTLRRFIESYEKFIDMFEKGTVYISKKVDVYELLDSDDEETLLRLVEQDDVQKHESSKFTDDFEIKLENDLKFLKEIGALWQDVATDPKLEQFKKELKDNSVLKGKKLIVFTESKETGEYLYEKLGASLQGKVMFFSSSGGLYDGAGIDTARARELITGNFDPGHKKQTDDIRILITTDVLAEGVNLHRSNIVINYDLPWNPTRVLQRVGRVNRVGSEHKKVFIFNFFPTAQSDKELGLEANIKAKIQAFHDTLGEDAKYLTDEEEVSAHKLFGDRLYKKLSDRKSYEGEDEGERSELEYLQEIRDVRDKEPALFEKIKRLPKKARSCRSDSAGSDRLITFFRKGKLKKFLLSDGAVAREVGFFSAADCFKCGANAERLPLPKSFYSMLEQNKSEFDGLTSGEALDMAGHGGRSNESYIIKTLKAKEFRQFKGFTEDDEEFLKAALRAFQDGVIPKNTSKKIKDAIEIKSESAPLKVLAVLRRNLSDNILADQASHSRGIVAKEVILSEYLIGKVGKA